MVSKPALNGLNHSSLHTDRQKQGRSQSLFPLYSQGNGLKLHQGTLRFDIRKNFFMEGVAKHWDRLAREMVQSPFPPLRDVWM